MATPSAPLLIMYGSQTGAAKSIAEGIHATAVSRRMPACLHPLNDYSSVRVSACSLLVIVVSTTGNGDPPTNAEDFWRHVRKRSHPADLYAGLNFTLLGLGDSNYDKFAHAGKVIAKRLSELGGVEVHRHAFADESMGLDSVVEPWLKSLWTALDSRFSTSTAVTTPVALAPVCTSTEGSHSPMTFIHTHLARLGPRSFHDLNPDVDVTGSGSVEGTSTLELPRCLTLQVGVSVGLSPPACAAVPPPAPHTVQVQPRLHAAQRLTTSTPAAAPPVGVGSARPFPVISARYLTTSTDRRVLSIDLKVPTSLAGGWSTGDSVGVLPPMPTSTVLEACTRLQLPPDTAVTLLETHDLNPVLTSRTDLNLGTFLTWATDLNASPDKRFMRWAASLATVQVERDTLAYLSGRGGANKAAFKSYVTDQRLSVLELLRAFPSVQVASQPEVFCSILPRTSPRFYSIASSPLSRPSVITLALTIVEYSVGLEPHVIKRSGCASHYLESIASVYLNQPLPAAAPREEPCVYAFLHPSRDFNLPSSATPIVMIGPGTGVAPFMSFLDHRAARVKRDAGAATAVCSGEWRSGCSLTDLKDESVTTPELSPAYLFFGNRDEGSDFLFREELNAHVATGVLTRLFTAWSRVGEKAYVTKRMAENAALLADVMMKQGGYVYVCGDGARMAKDVHAALVQALVAHGGEAVNTEAAANDMLNTLAKRGRYLRDIWS